MPTLELGQTVRSKYTEFTGTVTVIASYISGIVRVEVTAATLGANGELQTHWFDAADIE